MVIFIPGSVVLYREPDTDLPPWPSVYLTDEIAPRWFLSTRPHGYFSLILKLSRTFDASQLRWATTSNLRHFDPFVATERTLRSAPGLVEAYEVADNALDSGLDLKHWKAVLAADDDGEDAVLIHSDDDMSNDPDMLKAIELSMTDIRAQEGDQLSTSLAPRARPIASSLNSERPMRRNGVFAQSPSDNHRALPIRNAHETSRLPTPEPSPPYRDNAFGSYRQVSKRRSAVSSSDLDQDLSSPSQRRKLSDSFGKHRGDGYLTSSQTSQGTASVPFTLSDDDDPPTPTRRRQSGFKSTGLEMGTSSSTLGIPVPPSNRNINGKTVRPMPGVPPRPAYPDLSVAQPRSAPRQFPDATAGIERDGDTIEENLENSNHFVQVFVGSEVDPTTDPDVDPERKQHHRLLLKKHVWDRSYFRNTVHGISYITPIGENTWELTHPKLSRIDPTDFAFAAEYLSSGRFGHQHPDDEDQIEEAFAQCISAWNVAQTLNMDDLQEHIIDKVQGFAPWDMYNVFAFAVCVYDTNEVSSEACRRLKDVLSSFIAENFDIYLRDDALRDPFLDRLGQMSQLAIDVHKKYARIREDRQHPDEQMRAMLEQQELAAS